MVPWHSCEEDAETAPTVDTVYNAGWMFGDKRNQVTMETRVAMSKGNGLKSSSRLLTTPATDRACSIHFVCFISHTAAKLVACKN
jgi:hypothetical protein